MKFFRNNLTSFSFEMQYIYFEVKILIDTFLKCLLILIQPVRGTGKIVMNKYQYTIGQSPDSFTNRPAINQFDLKFYISFFQFFFIVLHASSVAGNKVSLIYLKILLCVMRFLLHLIKFKCLKSSVLYHSKMAKQIPIRRLNNKDRK